MKSFITILVASILLMFCITNGIAQESPDAEIVRLNGELAKSFSASNYKDALTAAARLVELNGQKFGKENIAMARALKNRGLCENALGDTANAEKTFEEATRVYKLQSDLSRSDGAGFAIMLQSLARIKMQVNLAAGESSLELAVEWLGKSYGPEAAQLTAPLSLLGNIKYWKRDYKSSAEVYERALKILIKTAGDGPDDSRSIVLSRTQCSFRKAKIEDRFEPLNKSYKARFSPDEPSNPPLDPSVASAGVLNGKATSLPPPTYPDAAKRQRLTGAVSVQVLINEKGEVVTACADAKADLILGESAEIAALRALFSPTLLKGNPIMVSGIITYNFTL